MPSDTPKRPRAVLVSVQLPQVTDAEHAAQIAELGRLVSTLGYDVAGAVTQRRESLAASAVLGEGKLRELASYTDGTGVVPGFAKETVSKARARFEAAAVGEDLDEDDAEALDDDDESTVDGASEEGIGSRANGSGGGVWGGVGTFAHAGAGAAEFVDGSSDGERPSLVVVDHEITPSQSRNLERATGRRGPRIAPV
ncbi:MAG: hypothetical protein QM784_19390 [Polyangiaceae bacterium]